MTRRIWYRHANVPIYRRNTGIYEAEIPTGRGLLVQPVTGDTIANICKVIDFVVNQRG